MIEINNVDNFEIEIGGLQSVGRSFLEYYDKIGFDVSVAIVGDEKMKELNFQYKKKDKTTDVLSFEASIDEKKEDKFLGEILISFPQIKKQSKEFDRTVKDELFFIFIHGLLHLLGFSDETEKKRENMIKLANEFLKKYEQDGNKREDRKIKKRD